MARWTKKDGQRLIQWYQDETGIMVFKMSAVIEFGKAKGIVMPVPPTPEQLLERKLSDAARADRREHAEMATNYRGTLCYRRSVNGQEEFYWFDADGTAATLENVKKAQQLRKETALNVLVQIGATDRHWMLTHPGQGTLFTDFNMADEVTWRLNGPAKADEDEQKAG